MRFIEGESVQPDHKAIVPELRWVLAIAVGMLAASQFLPFLENVAQTTLNGLQTDNQLKYQALLNELAGEGVPSFQLKHPHLQVLTNLIVVSPIGLNIRPDTSADNTEPTIGQLANRYKIPLAIEVPGYDKREQTSWVAIDDNGQTGFVAEKYLLSQQP